MQQWRAAREVGGVGRRRVARFVGACGVQVVAIALVASRREREWKLSLSCLDVDPIVVIAKLKRAFRGGRRQDPSSPLLLLPMPPPSQTLHLLLPLLVLILLLPWLFLPRSSNAAPNPGRGIAKTE